MLCGDVAEVMQGQFAFVESDQYYGAILANNERYAHEIRRMFRGSMFGHVASFLFIPSPEVASQISKFREENVGRRRSIGLHVRTHTLGHPGYTEPYALDDPKGHFLNSYWKCALFAAETLTADGGDDDDQVLWFLAQVSRASLFCDASSSDDASLRFAGIARYFPCNRQRRGEKGGRKYARFTGCNPQE